MIEPRRSSLISGHGLLAATSTFTAPPEHRATPLGYVKATVFTVVFPAVTAMLSWTLINEIGMQGPAILMAAVPAWGALWLGFMAARNTLTLAKEDSFGAAALRDPGCLLDLRSVMGERRNWLYEHQEALAAAPHADAALLTYARAVADEYQRFMKGHIGTLDPAVTRLEEHLAASLVAHAQDA